MSALRGLFHGEKLLPVFAFPHADPSLHQISGDRLVGWNAIITASARSGLGVPSGFLSTVTFPPLLRE